MSDIQSGRRNSLRSEMNELIRLTQLCNPTDQHSHQVKPIGVPPQDEDIEENYEISYKKVKLNNECEKKIEVHVEVQGESSTLDIELSKRLRSFNDKVEKFKQTYGYNDQNVSPNFGGTSECDQPFSSATKRKINYEEMETENLEPPQQGELLSSIKKLSHQIQILKDSTRKDFESFKDEAHKRMEAISNNPVKNKATLKFMNKVQAKMESLGFIPRVAFLKPSSKHNQSVEELPRTPGFKARPLPKFKPFEIKHEGKHEIKQKAFNLSTEIRGETYKKKFQEEAERVLKMKTCVKTFKACPLPDYDQLARTGLKTVKIRDTTKPKEFDLKTEKRALYQKPTHETRSTDSDTTHQFKSQPMPDFSKPFIPLKGRGSLTELDAVALKSEKRAQQRTEYEKNLKEREQLRILKKKIEEEEKKRNELKEIQDLRKSLSFKARPIGFEKGGLGRRATSNKDIHELLQNLISKFEMKMS
jgi:vacuolar-type H+-ATPase subunit I/STV1